MKLASACTPMEVKAKAKSRGTVATVPREKKESEKKRRQRMKALCQNLTSLIPKEHNPHADASTQLDQLDSAAEYIKQLRGRVDGLKRRKQTALSGGTVGCSSSVSTGDYKGASSSPTTALPVIDVRHQDGTLDVALASEAGRPFQLHEVIAVMEQAGAEVITASFSVVGDKIFYAFHSQALCPRIGLDANGVAQRLRGLAAADMTQSWNFPCPCQR